MQQNQSNSNAHSLSTIAKLLNLSERRVQQLARDGIIPKGFKGQYDLIGCIRGYTLYLQKQLTQSDFRDLKEEKTRLVKFQADRAEIDLAIIQGEAVLITDIEKKINDMVSIVRARLLALPNKLAPVVSVENEVSVVESIIKDGICEALAELSNLNLSSK